jgi:uncharacterized damage-inducible protein DinB
MTQPTDSARVLLLEHKAWATLKLMEACRALTKEQLATTVPSTYGTIHGTLQHLVADEGYWRLLTGEEPEQRLGPDRLVPLDELVGRTRALAPKWTVFAANPMRHGGTAHTSDGWEVARISLIAQAVHHADDHRSHVRTIIGAHGFELPGLDIGGDLDVWHHAIDAGLMRPR